MLTEEELSERLSNKKPRGKYWMICDKCGNDQAQRNICKCGKCSKDKERMFVHINEPNPKTIDWSSYDPELKVYSRHGCYDVWSLCDHCSKRIQMYADWTTPHKDVILI